MGHANEYEVKQDYKANFVLFKILRPYFSNISRTVELHLNVSVYIIIWMILLDKRDAWTWLSWGYNGDIAGYRRIDNVTNQTFKEELNIFDNITKRVGCQKNGLHHLDRMKKMSIC
jgi:hypothetical protein